MSPDREKKIVRQHSQAQAIAFLTATQKDGFTLADVKTCTDWFDKDVLGAEAAGATVTQALQVPAQTLNDVLVGATNGSPMDSDTPPF